MGRTQPGGTRNAKPAARARRGRGSTSPRAPLRRAACSSCSARNTAAVRRAFCCRRGCRGLATTGWTYSISTPLTASGIDCPSRLWRYHLASRVHRHLLRRRQHRHRLLARLRSLRSRRCHRASLRHHHSHHRSPWCSNGPAPLPPLMSTATPGRRSGPPARRPWWGTRVMLTCARPFGSPG